VEFVVKVIEHFSFDLMGAGTLACILGLCQHPNHKLLGFIVYNRYTKTGLWLALSLIQTALLVRIIG
jgi:hypothetical protein